MKKKAFFIFCLVSILVACNQTSQSKPRAMEQSCEAAKSGTQQFQMKCWA